MKVSIVAAVARDRTIGADGKMPWRIPSDLLHFRALTWGHAVVMGRRTFDSIGRPLDGRRNIVITRNPHFHADGVERADSLEFALALARMGEQADGEIFIIGGGEIYDLALRGDFVRQMILTEIDLAAGGDVFFPRFSPDEWRETEREKGTGDIPHDFVRYRRVG